MSPHGDPVHLQHDHVSDHASWTLHPGDDGLLDDGGWLALGPVEWQVIYAALEEMLEGGLDGGPAQELCARLRARIGRATTPSPTHALTSPLEPRPLAP